MRYWPLLVIVLVLAAILGLSWYDDVAEQRQQDLVKRTAAAPVNPDSDQASPDAAQASPDTAPATPAENAQPKGEQDKPYKRLVWAKYVAWPEGVGVWAIILTLLVFAWQAIEVRAAAQATNASNRRLKAQIDIQSAGMRQWVEVKVLKSLGKTVFPTDGGAPESQVEIWFRALNRTAYPLTIDGVDLKVSTEQSGAPRWEPYSRREKVILAPGAGAAENPEANPFEYRFHLTLGLDERMTEQYEQGMLVVSVSGNVLFTPVVGKAETQAFGYGVQCGSGVAEAIQSGSQLHRARVRA
jgi:type II secretory pathway pseudopilin PulG